MSDSSERHGQYGTTDQVPYSKMSGVFDQRTASKCCAQLVHHLKPNFKVLDVGCGPGSITIDLARLLPGGHVVGIDISADILEKARSTAKEQGITNVEFLHCNAEDLSQFEDEAFDVAHAHMVLMHLSNHLKCLKEMRRVVKSGTGMVAARDNAHLLVHPPTPLLQDQLTIFDKITRAKGGDVYGGRANHMWAHEAGFAWDRIEMSTGSWEYSGPVGRRMWVAGARDSIRAVAVKGGWMTDEEMDVVNREWDAWGEKSEARVLGLDGAILCWK